MQLTRKIPASVDLTGKSLKLDISYKGAINGEFRSLLESKLRALLAGHEGKGVRLVKTGEDAILSAQISSADTKTDKGDPKNTMAFTSQILEYTGKSEATLEVADGKGNPLESSPASEYHFTRHGIKVTVKTKFGIPFPLPPMSPHTSELTPQQLQAILAEGMAHKIAHLVVNLDDTFNVPLPSGGTFDSVRKPLEGKKWGEASEAADKLQVDDKNQPMKEYLIGLTSEAVAYAEHDQTKIIDSLNRADQHYAAAVEKKSDYKDASEADDRVKDSIEYYLTIQSSAKKESDPVKPEPAKTSTETQVKPPAPPKEPEKPAAPAYTEGENSALVYLKGQGLTTEMLIGYINNADHPKFDIKTAAGLGQLYKAGIPQPVIDAIKKRMYSASPPRSSGTKKP